MNRTFFPIALAVVLVVVAGWFLYQRTTSGSDEPTPSPSPTASANPDGASPTPGPIQTLEGGVQVQDLIVGDGEEATSGSTVAVHYIGWLADTDENGDVVTGTQFDSSVGGDPFQFTIGAGDVIPGWDIGVAGMKVGGVRILLIPPAMGYGAQGAGDVIPPNAALIFQVQLLGVGK
jgi:FKBP-type peptidyl-prolyl cis-trans isomerase FkpA